MSLVICSNQVADGSSEGRQNSIYKPWSFRNQLTSTYTIPANAQVALQSVKVNVDGRIVLSRQNNVFYQYFGKKLNLDGVSAPQMINTPNHTLRVALLRRNEVDTAVKEFSVEDFANRLGERMGNSVYHPNLQGKTSVDILRNASGLDFLGYKITVDQHLSASNVNGSLVNIEDHFDNTSPNRNGSGYFHYDSTGKVFSRNASYDLTTEFVSGILYDNPLSLSNGTFVVNISNASANVNSVGKQVPFTVGLSRYIRNANQDGYFIPYYNDDQHDDDMDLPDGGYMDFGVGRNDFGELVCFHTAWDNTENRTRKYEIEYWNNASSDFTVGRKDMDDEQYDKIRFTGAGETLKVEIHNASTTAWEIITQYSGTATAGNKNSQFNPIHQACWCLHPVLQVGRNAVNTSGSMVIEEFKTPPIPDYNVKKLNRSGWWETQELLNRLVYCRNVESRSILDTNNTVSLYTQIGVNPTQSNRITGLNNVLILEDSSVYTPSRGANARVSLGFNSGVVDTPDNLNPSEFHSNFAPSLVSSQAIFVRLDNFNQRVINALTGNKSQIIAHLPRFDSTQTTGRLYFEPQNFVWIDLDNTNEINITDFNISFCYSNEQYAQILIGQSIVCLYFRKKPKELM